MLLTDDAAKAAMSLATTIYALRGWTPALFGAIAGGVIVLEFSALSTLFPFTNDAAERALCDQAVAALLHSKDLVEVQRAGIIIHEISCGIGRRLTEPAK